MLTLKIANPVTTPRTNAAHHARLGPTHWPSVFVVTDQTVVRVGLMAMLESDDVRADVSTGVDGCLHAQADLVLFDVALLDKDPRAVEPWLASPGATVVAVCSESRPDLTARAVCAGIEWGITLGVTAAELRDVVRGVAAGVLAETANATRWRIEPYPGEACGLSPREAEVLELIASGMSNAMIATHLSVSINSVKSYIRLAYRKINVTSRSQAVAWAIRRGLGGTGPGPHLPLGSEPGARVNRSWVR